MKYKILIVEDEVEIVNLITKRLDTEKYDITVAYSGDEGLRLIQSTSYDLLSLDIMLPSVDGLIICKAVREKDKDALIIIVSALDLDEKKEKAYALGADDYISKPFSPKLVALKIEALLQRRKELKSTGSISTSQIIHQDGDLKRFYIQKRPLGLTPSEYTILERLYKTPKKVFSKEELSQILYDEDIGNIDRDGIGTHIYQLRKKITQLSKKEIIRTVRGVGYTLYED
jgi:DNA-binding response OmpR family regulator